MIEEEFGTCAGIVWESLNINGEMTAAKLLKISGLDTKLLYAALGWLGREGKIEMKQKGKDTVFKLV